MRQSLREGLEGRTFKSTLMIYVYASTIGLPASTIVALLWDKDIAIKATPGIAIVIMIIMYIFAYTGKR